MAIKEVWRTLEHYYEPPAMRHRFFGLPVSLPNLDVLRPLGGNTCLQSLAQSYSKRQRRGALASSPLLIYHIACGLRASVRVAEVDLP